MAAANDRQLQRFWDARTLLRDAADSRIETPQEAAAFAVKCVVSCANVPGMAAMYPAVCCVEQFKQIVGDKACARMEDIWLRFLPLAAWVAVPYMHEGLRGQPTGIINILGLDDDVHSSGLSNMSRDQDLLLLLSACCPWPIDHACVLKQFVVAHVAFRLWGRDADVAATLAHLRTLPLPWGQGLMPASSEELYGLLGGFVHATASAAASCSGMVAGLQEDSAESSFDSESVAFLLAETAVVLAPGYTPARLARAYTASAARNAPLALSEYLEAGRLAAEAGDTVYALWAHYGAMTAIQKGGTGGSWTAAQALAHARPAEQLRGCLDAYASGPLLKLRSLQPAVLEMGRGVEEVAASTGGYSLLACSRQAPSGTVAAWAKFWDAVLQRGMNSDEARIAVLRDIVGGSGHALFTPAAAAARAAATATAAPRSRAADAAGSSAAPAAPAAAGEAGASDGASRHGQVACTGCGAVLDKPKFCSVCRAPYCSSQCQAADWMAGHKKACRKARGG